VGQQNPYDPSIWNTPAGQPGQFGSQPGPFGNQPGQFGNGLPPTPPSQGIGLVPKALAVVGGLVAAGILLLAVGSNFGHNASRAVGSLSATPTVTTHYIKAEISTKGLDETISFKVVSTDTEKKAFADGFQKGISDTPNMTAQVSDISALPTNAVYVCQINLPASHSQTLQSVQVYGVNGDSISRDIAQGGCDGANTSS
jgi:hypothetical protein